MKLIVIRELLILFKQILNAVFNTVLAKQRKIYENVRAVVKGAVTALANFVKENQ